MYRFSLVSIILSLIFIATNHILSYEEALANGFTDIKSYYYIANNSIDKYYITNSITEHSFLEFSVSIHILERWPIYKLIGLISNTLDLDLWITFRIVAVLLIALCILIINSLKTTDNNKIAILSIILFNPYTFRSYYGAGMVGDGAFMIALLLITCGIMNKSYFQIIIGSAAAIMFRQTGILLIPIYLVLFYSKYLPKRTMVSSSLVILIGFFTIKLATMHLYNPSVTIGSFYYIENIFSIFPWIFNQPKLTEAISFLGRYIFFLLTLGCLALCFNKLIITKSLIIFSGIFFFMHLQPIGGGPLSVGNNIQRLCSLGLPFLIPIIINSNLKDKIIIYFVLISMMVSFHHNTSILYYYGNAKIIFLALVVLSFIFSIYLRFSLNNVKKIS